MSVYIPPQQPKKKIWPYAVVGGSAAVVAVALVAFLNAGGVDTARTVMSEISGQNRTPVTRASGVETLVLPPSGSVAPAAQPPQAEQLLEMPSSQPNPVAIAALANGAIEAAAQVAPIRTRAEIVDDRVWQEQISSALDAAHHTKVQEISDAVVAGLYTVTAEAVPGAGRPRFELTNTANPAEAEEIEELLTEAVASGALDVPAAIQTGDGGFDAQALLFDLVQTNLQAGGEEEIAAAETLRQQTIAAVGAETETRDGEQFYIVQAGDNLGYISLLMFGTVSDYARIFEANRDILSDPDRIQIGQRLRIPSA